MTGLHSTVTVLLEPGAPVPHALIEALRGCGWDPVRCTSSETALVLVQALQPAMVMVTSEGTAGEAETFLRVLHARRTGVRPALVRVGACAQSSDGGATDLADAFVSGAVDIAPLLARLDLQSDAGKAADGSAKGDHPTSVAEQTELHLRQQLALGRLALAAASASRIDDLLQRTTEWVARAQTVEMCKVLRLDADRSALTLVAGVGWSPGLVGIARVSSHSGSQAGYTLHASEPVRVLDLRRELRFSAPSLLVDHGVRSGMSVVILAGGVPWGVLGAHAREVRSFTKADACFMQAVAQILSSTIERLALCAAPGHGSGRMQDAELISQMGAWTHEPVGDRLSWSPQMFEIFGIRPAEFAGNLAGFLQLVHPQDRARVYQARLDGLAGAGLPEIAYTAQRPDGLVRELLERCEWVPSSDANTGRLVGTVLDVTDLRAAQHRADRLVALLTEAQRVANMGAWELDLVTRRVIWSRETSALFGIAPDAFGGDEDAFLLFVLPQDRQRLIDASRQADGGVETEYRIQRPDGQVRWIQQRDRLLVGPGLPGRRMGVVMDVTERRSAELMTQWEAQVLEAVLGAGDLHSLLNLLVQGLEEIMPGVLASIMLLDDDGRHLRRGASPNLPPAYMDAIDGLAIGPAQGSCGTAAHRKSQVIVSDIAHDPLWADWQALAHAHGLGACWSNPVLGQDGRLLGTLALYRRQAVAPAELELQLMARAVRVAAIAIERARDARALRASEDLMRQTLEGAATGIAVTTLDYRFLDANAAYCRMIGYTVDELRQRDASELTHADDLPEMTRLTGELLRGERTSYVVVRRNLTKSGQIVWVRRSVSVRRDAQGVAIGLIGVAEDITRQKSAEAELARSQSLLRVALRVARMGAWAMTLPDRSLTWSDEACAIFDELPGYRATAEQVLAFFHSSHVERVRNAFRSCIEEGVDFELESPITTRQGRTLWVRCIAEVVLGSQDEVVQVHGAIQDIDAHRQAEQQIRDSEQRFRLLAEATQDAIWEWNLETDAVWWSAGMYRLYGVDPAASSMDSRRWSRGEASSAWLDHVHPAERDDAAAALRAFASGQSDRWSHEYRFRLPDGSYATVIDRGFALRDAQGAMLRMVGGISDVTRTRRLEEQLRQSQRLEAVGQLTGGLAHDFNNLLTVIMGNAEMLADELPQGDDKGDLARMIGDAAQRGAELTQRMLAFARRQPLTPQSVDINEMVGGMDKLLRRTLGEHIEIRFTYAAGLQLALVDPAQFENALLNLCLNARDAMGEGGRLTVTTSCTHVDAQAADLHGELAPGSYVTVVVSDTGRGIAPELLGRVVEPFFTTKVKGNGTGLGLGLSMVYGFLKQSRGHLDISSQSGQGTTATMYLPRAQHATPEQAPAQTVAPASESGTILLVEDNAQVRRYASSQLVSLGYTVREAVDGPSALRAIVQDVEREIDLLFTDVVMPGGMDGPALADAAHALRPQLPVLFTSGYTENIMERDGRLGASMQLLGKPYRRAELARRIAEMMALAERSHRTPQDSADPTGNAVAGWEPTGEHAA